MGKVRKKKVAPRDADVAVALTFEDAQGLHIVEPEVILTPLQTDMGPRLPDVSVRLSRHLLVELIRKIDDEPKPWLGGGVSGAAAHG